jgi:hypothetical protein
MYGADPFSRVPYAATFVVAMDARGLVGLSIQGLFSVVIASALAPAGKCVLQNAALFSVTLSDSVTE